MNLLSYCLCAVKDMMYICPFSGLINGTLTITDYKMHFTSVERVQQIKHHSAPSQCVTSAVLMCICAPAGVSIHS